MRKHEIVFRQTDNVFQRSVPALALALCVCVPTHAQDRPRFRSGVEVTSIDVTVVDDRGRPIPDLTLAEFIVRVDGVPRRAVSAEWVSGTANTAARATVPPSPEHPGSNDAADGRLILIVIDQPNIRFGGTIGHRAAINHFIDRLQPSDRISIVNLGAGGKSVEFTTDRGRSKEAVSSSTGGVPYPPSDKTAGDLTLDVLRAVLNDLRTIDRPKTLLLSESPISRQSGRTRPSIHRPRPLRRRKVKAVAFRE